MKMIMTTILAGTGLAAGIYVMKESIKGIKRTNELLVAIKEVEDANLKYAQTLNSHVGKNLEAGDLVKLQKLAEDMCEVSKEVCDAWDKFHKIANK